MDLLAEKITPRQISKKLVEKHRGFLSAYTREFDLLQGIIVLKEKQCQLEHWMEDATLEDDEKKYNTYLKQRKKTEKDMLKLTKELDGMKSPENYDPKQRHEFLKKSIDSQRQAINYWSNLSENG